MSAAVNFSTPNTIKSPNFDLSANSPTFHPKTGAPFFFQTSIQAKSPYIWPDLLSKVFRLEDKYLADLVRLKLILAD